MRRIHRPIERMHPMLPAGRVERRTQIHDRRLFGERHESVAQSCALARRNVRVVDPRITPRRDTEQFTCPTVSSYPPQGGARRH